MISTQKFSKSAYLFVVLSALILPTMLWQPLRASQQKLVKLRVTVSDKTDKSVEGLLQNDFQLFEDKKPQAITFFAKEDIPVSYGMIVDTSGSLKEQLSDIVATAQNIIRSNRANDETFLVRLIDGGSIGTNWTSDKTFLLEALDKFRTASGKTLLIDTIAATKSQFVNISKTSDGAKRRKMLIVLTDGLEKNSTGNLNQLLAQFKEQGVQIWAISFYKNISSGRLFGDVDRQKAADLLERLSRQTNGKAFFPVKMAETSGIASQILDYRRTQYVIGYAPSRIMSKEIESKLKVKLIEVPEYKKYSIDIIDIGT